MSVNNHSATDNLTLTPFRQNVQDQPEAIERFLGYASSKNSIAPLPELFSAGRVIISGMGSSHFTSYPIYTALIKAGVSAWWIDSSQLLTLLPEIVTPGTMLWLTSQSGESGETLQIIDRISKEIYVVGVTNNVRSALANRANTLIELNSGDEATVSTKSYLNSVLVARIVAGEISKNRLTVMSKLERTGDEVRRYLDNHDRRIQEFSKFGVDRTIQLLGRGDAAISASAAALILKEAAKVPAEGMSAGVFRHGPIEISSQPTSVAIFNHGRDLDADLNQDLANELISNGVEVAWIGNQDSAPSGILNIKTSDSLEPLISDALAFQTMSFAFAKRKGLEAGKFLVAKKITQKL